MEVKGEGGVTVTEVNEVEDILFLLEEAFDEGEGVSEGSRVEEGRRHCRRGLVSKKAYWLSCKCLDDCLKNYYKSLLLL